VANQAKNQTAQKPKSKQRKENAKRNPKDMRCGKDIHSQ
jgi:hypothetical protein